MHEFGVFELDIRLGLLTAWHPSELPSYATPGARTGDCSSLRNAHPSRSWKGRSIPCKTSWTRSGNEPAEPSRLPTCHCPFTDLSSFQDAHAQKV